MRKINVVQILSFGILLGIILTLGVGTAWFTLGPVPLGDFRGIAIAVVAGFLIYGYAFIAYRLFLRCIPLQIGELAPGSRAEFAAQVNISVLFDDFQFARSNALRPRARYALGLFGARRDDLVGILTARAYCWTLR